MCNIVNCDNACPGRKWVDGINIPDTTDGLSPGNSGLMCPSNIWPRHNENMLGNCEGCAKG